MIPPHAPLYYEFGRFRLYPSEQLLLRDGAPVPLQRKAFDTLVLLAEHHGRLIEKDEFLRRVWADTFVEEGSLTVNISLLRKALGKDADGRDYIETVPRRGYRFVGAVREVIAAEEARDEVRAQSTASASDAAPSSTAQRASGLEANAKGAARATIEAGVQGAAESARNEATYQPSAGPQRWGRRVAVVGLAVLLLTLVVANYRQPPPATPLSLAVLPLVNLQPDVETDFLGYSLADALNAKLSQIHLFETRPTSVVSKYRDRTTDLARVAAELNVKLLVTGRYRKEGEELRVHAELVEAPQMRTLFEDEFVARYEQLSTLHEQVARRLISELNLNLTGAEEALLRRDEPRDEQAWKHYLRGVDHYAEGRLAEAINELEQAVARDDHFARAYELLGSAYAVNASVRFGGRVDYQRAESCFNRAIALDATQPRAHAYHADLLIETNRVEQAIRLLRELIHKHPNYALAHWELSYAYRYVGMLDESSAAGRRAHEVDPGFSLRTAVFITHLYRGDYAQFLQSLPPRAGSAYVAFYRGFALYYQGHNADAQAEFDRAYDLDAESLQTRIGKALSLHLTGQKGAAITLLRAVERQAEQHGVSDAEGVYKIAQAYAALGENKSALRVFRRSVAGGFLCYPYFVIDPLLNGLRPEPGFAAALAQARLQHEEFKRRVQ